MTLLFAALSGFIAVAIGAFGAHGVTDERARTLIETGARYQMFHTLAVFAALWLAERAPAAQWAAPAFLLGVALFSGSLYALAFGAPRFIGAVTPIGGLFFLMGWLVLAWAALRRS